MIKILGVGNALVDMLIRLKDDDTLSIFGLEKGSMQLADLPLAEKVLSATEQLPRSMASGGSAANTIHALAKMGVQVGFVGKVADDELGRFFTKDMATAGVTSHMQISQTPTGKAVTLISPDSERTFATFLGAAAELSPSDITDEVLASYDYLYLEGYLLFNRPLMDNLFTRAKKAGVKVCLDLASYNVVEATLDYLKKAIPAYVDIVFANEEEAKAYTGKEPEEALKVLAKECEVAVVKIGKKGSLLQSGDLDYVVAPQLRQAVDTTGAGDLYAAGFLLGIDKGWQLDECGIAGSLVSGEIVEVVGAKMDEERWTKVKKALGI